MTTINARRRVFGSGAGLFLLMSLIFCGSPAWAQGKRKKVSPNTSLMIDPGDMEPAGAYINAPAGGSHLPKGVPIPFSGDTDFGNSFTWSFGDGTTATGLTPTKTYAVAGSYTITFKAAASGFLASLTSMVITVDPSPTIDTTAPSVTASEIGTSGTITLSATASDNVGVTKVEFYVDAALKGTDTTYPYSLTLNSTTLTNASHTLTAKAYDAAGNVKTSTGVTFTINNADTTAPTVTASEIGTSGTITLSATASDNVGVTKVEFYVDAALKGTDTTSPYSLTLNSTTLTNASHTLTAKAYDAAGNVKTSAGLAFSVNNAAAPAGLSWKRDVLYLGTKEVAEIDASGVHVTLTDHLGSPRFLVNPDGTTVEQKFMPFGESLADLGTQTKFAKGFTNHEQTDPSGLIYMQARFYLPMYHRFASPDPGRDQHFEDTQSWNIYSYVRNNPTMQVDPNGEEVRVYTERLGGAALLGDVRHSWIRVKTDRYDKLIERGGDGNIKIANWYAGAEKRGIGSREIKVDRPQGVGEGDYRFENGILATAKTLKGNEDEGHKDSEKSQNSDAMPPYDKRDANCNGFTQLLLQENGGSADLGPIGLVLELFARGEVHSAKTHLYKKKYEEYKKKEAEKKKEEEKKKIDDPK